jgi:DNA polymerase alpha subunit A
VQVAIKMQARGKSVRVGDAIPYLVCSAESVQAYLDQNPEASAAGAMPNLGSYAQRSFPPDEFEDSKGLLKLDTEWYMTQQIHPPISRLCEPIEGTDPSQLAMCLGLDPSKFRSSFVQSNSGGADEDEELFGDVGAMDDR